MIRSSALMVLVAVIAAVALDARTARSEVPTSTLPRFIYVVCPLDPGNPDVDGADGPPYAGGVPALAGTNASNVIVLRDKFANPIPHVGIHIRFPCDIRLCTLSPGPPYTTTWQQTVTCEANGSTLHAVTDENGRVEFVAYGAACDPGGANRLAGGGTNNSTLVTVDGYVGTYITMIGIALDQNGGTGSGAGVTAADAAIVMGTALAGFGATDRARANLDGVGVVTGVDAALELGHAFRLALAQTGGCAGSYCAVIPCP